MIIWTRSKLITQIHIMNTKTNEKLTTVNISATRFDKKNTDVTLWYGQDANKKK